MAANVKIKVIVPVRGEKKGNQNSRVIQRRSYWISDWELARNPNLTAHELALRKAKKALTRSATYELSID